MDGREFGVDLERTLFCRDIDLLGPLKTTFKLFYKLVDVKSVVQPVYSLP